MEEIKEKTVNLCAHIPASLHNRVREAQQSSGMTLNEYMTRLITEYYERKEGTTMKDTKTLAVQIPTELFDALDEYIARHPEVKSKKDLITSLIVKLLEDEKDAAPAEE